MSTDVAAAELAATTNWHAYDGEVLPQFRLYVILLPAIMAAFLLLPMAFCCCCLARGRVVAYAPRSALPPEYPGRGNYGRKKPYIG